MQRRDFLAWTGSGIVFGPSSLALFTPASPQKTFPIYGEGPLIASMIREQDAAIQRLLSSQNRNKTQRGYGGIPNPHGIETAMGTAIYIQYMATAYGIKESKYFHSDELFPALNQAIDFLLRIQHKDGSIDLHSTNFHSTPDTGFVVEPLAVAFGLLQKEKNDAFSSFLAKLKRFLLDAGRNLRGGGIHTPNHRWVVCMALARIHHLFPDPKNLTRIETWLGEGIDIDTDGQYTEKSTYIYSPLTNRCLITIARLLDKPKLLEPVRKNLEMTLFYLHPDGQLVTEASGRQDQYQKGSLRSYHYSYRYMALKDANGRFAAITRQIPRLLVASQLVRDLAYFQEDKTLLADLPEPAPLPENYEKLFSESGLARIRRGIWDATILAGNPTFFTMQHGEAVLQGIRVASAFFGKGQFQGEKLLREDQGYVLEQYLKGPYYQPYPKDELPGTGNWDQMPRSRRPQSQIQTYKAQIRVEEQENGCDIHIQITGTDHVPVAVELGFKKGGTLTGVEAVKGIPDAYLLNQQHGTYSLGQDQIRFGPGQVRHTWTQLRGALPKLDAMSVYLTGMTPFTHTVEIRKGK